MLFDKALKQGRWYENTPQWYVHKTAIYYKGSRGLIHQSNFVSQLSVLHLFFSPQFHSRQKMTSYLFWQCTTVHLLHRFAINLKYFSKIHFNCYPIGKSWSYYIFGFPPPFISIICSVQWHAKCSKEKRKEHPVIQFQHA